MAKTPQRLTEVSPADVSRVVKPVRPSGSPSAETARAADSVPLPVGPFTVLPMRFGRYEIRNELGRGQMGAVYLAKDIELDRLVALKVARTSATGSAKLLKRMEIEAKSAAKLDHPLICKVYDAGEINGIRFIALQYIEGEDLKKFMKRLGRKREPTEAVRLILQILRAIETAHEKGIIHRDLKPENVMLNKMNQPMIMDFGLARQTIVSSDAGLTQGMIVGSAAYMSPEQATGRAEMIDHRSDLYAVGVMLFEMLTGEWPFTGGSIEVMGKKSVLESPSPLSLNPTLNPQLAAVCQKMIAKEKGDRYGTCGEVVKILEAIDLTVFAPIPSTDRVIEPLISFGPPVIRIQQELSKSSSKKMNALRWSDSGFLASLMIWWKLTTTVVRISAAVVLGSSMLGFALVLFASAGDALIQIEIHSDNVAVTFQKETVTLADGTHEFHVKPGDQTLHIKSGDIEFDTDRFRLKRGSNPAVTVELVNSAIVSKLGDHEIGRRSLGVRSRGQAQTNHDDKNKTTIPTPSEVLPPLQKNVVKVGDVWKGNRTYQRGQWAGTTVWYELHVTEVEREIFKGHVFDKGTGLNRAEVEGSVDGEKIHWRETFHRPGFDDHTDVTGKISDTAIHLKFQRHLTAPRASEGVGELRFQTTTELDHRVGNKAGEERESAPDMVNTAPLPTGPPEGFVSIFNGKDLRGWTQMTTSGPNNDILRLATGGWIVRERELICVTDKPGLLQFDKVCGNCELNFEFFLPAGTNSGLIVLHPGHAKFSLKSTLEIQLEDDPSVDAPEQKCGGIYGVIAPKTNAFKQGQWNRTVVRLESGRIVVQLNDELVIDAQISDYEGFRNLPAVGHFALLNWNGKVGRSKGCKFRNIWIKELK